MRRLTFLTMGLAFAWAAFAQSEPQRTSVAPNCKDKQSVQLLSSADPVEGEPGKVTCTVKYWVCGQHFTQTQVSPNQPGACERFTGAVRRRVGGEACCDCFPNCAPGVQATKRKPAPVAAEAPATAGKSDSAGRVVQLENRVRELEARLQALEQRLGAEEIDLSVSGSSIKLRGDGSGGIVIMSEQDVSIRANRDVSIAAGRNASIRASGNVQIKDSRPVR
jgi:hypothetical protein